MNVLQISCISNLDPKSYVNGIWKSVYEVIGTKWDLEDGAPLSAFMTFWKGTQTRKLSVSSCDAFTMLWWSKQATARCYHHAPGLPELWAKWASFLHNIPVIDTLSQILTIQQMLITTCASRLFVAIILSNNLTSMG